MNDADSASPRRYALSFTTGALLSREGALLAPVYLVHRDWNEVRDVAQRGNLLQSRTYSTGVRRVRESVERVSSLNDEEIELLVESTSSERAHLMWVAACRRYELIGEFAEEVVREHFLRLALKLDHGDFDSFVRAKVLWHEELAMLKESTVRKLRSNVFRMLREADLLSEAGDITPAVLSARVAAKLSARTPSDLRFFPTHQMNGQRSAW